MENDFAYEQLSPRAFEQLAVAIAESVIGAGLEVYGPGPDGGREATWSGKINWSLHDPDDHESWQGYTVIQVKQCQNPTQDPERDLAWLVSEMNKELKKWIDPESKRSRFPENLLLITNVRLTPADPGGTMQKLDGYLAERLIHNYGNNRQVRTLRSRGLRNIKVWHRNKLTNLLTNNASARQRFAPLITLGDVLARLDRLPGSVPKELVTKLFVDHAHNALETGRWVRFDDAGDDDSRHPIDKIVIDLPVDTPAGRRSTALIECLTRGDRLLRRSLLRASRLGEEPRPRHVVITGAAGNGKSTLSRYLAHVYRANFARWETAPPAGVATLIEDAFVSLDRLQLDCPSIPRWPIRIDLTHMADEMGPTPDGGPSIQRYVCNRISDRAGVPVHPETLENWMKVWPCVVIFDGLDEVTHPALRHRVLTEVTQLVSRADDLDCDMFVIVTTRPTGYTERLLPEHFAQLDLAYLTVTEAADYGHFVTTKRLANDEPEYRQSVLDKFDRATSTAGVQRLMKTPLQVLILTVIVASTGVLPTNRYRLFWNYFDTVFKREANKRTGDQTFLNSYRTEIEDIHRRVGLVLHQRCETTSTDGAKLPLTELHDIAFERLREDGHQIPRANELATKLVSIATQRLVLLTADEDHTVTFDVRSLQELMAGRALVSAGEIDHRHNLTVAARSPHWRNAWLFAAGELFDGGSYDRDLVLKVVEECDFDEKWPGWLYPIAPELAADILDDGLAANKPVFVSRLVDCVLRCLEGPMPTEPKKIALGLTAAATENDQRLSIRERLAAALTGTPVQHAVASALIHYGSFGARVPGEPINTARYADMWVYRGPKPQGSAVKLGRLLRGAIEQYGGPNPILSQQLIDALGDCDNLQLQYNEVGEMRPLTQAGSNRFKSENLMAVLNDPDNSQLLQIAVEELSEDDWPAKSLLARACWPVLARRPVATELRSFADKRPQA
ncbi:hypothetical protein AU184_25950 [Mycolicibacterium novocastrense]|uniref:NACHT domain-containing protein n=1 Tax=Mycolicibacterium novocastrense TaxID=59813 RepID=UPI000746827B|nr:ATP-binding protein [Mycolicibacterium novocastrense]KUH70843.1 hypothetical protein AU072_18345 [Mycolicibacterium novocastrense]KUH71184.1 hypothetical protein AU183_20270 [Mycolicibacterium novocastrense]KUH73299.1 hypothetical protein AU184_25950 [Mycolicibacterium novocastrense]